MTLSSFFTEDHRACDRTWAEVERLVDGGQDLAAVETFERFAAEMEHHFTMEEQVLFPAFEQATGMTAGPTQVMRSEHQQMRGLLAQMQEAAKGGDLEAVVEHGDTLLMVIQQHNMKEEGMLYPLCDGHLADQAAAVEESCRAI